MVWNESIRGSLTFCENSIYAKTLVLKLRPKIVTAAKKLGTKLLLLAWIPPKNKVKVRLGTFLNFVYGSSYLGAKKVHGYLISFEPRMVQSSYKDDLVRLFLRSMKLKYPLP